MPKFRYTVINEENKQLQGTIGAPDEKKARQELNELGFSILSIEEIAEETPEQEAEGISPYEFSAIDKNRKRVVGTIKAESKYAAFVRLIKEYDFAVEYIIENSLDEKARNKEIQKGAVELYAKYEDENMGSEKKATADEKDIKEFEQKQEVLKQQIDFVLGKVKSMLDLYEKDMKIETKTDIRKQVEKLLRIKNSTNLEYVRKTAEDLLNFLQKEEIFLHEETRTKEKTQMIVEAKSLMMQLKKGGTKKSRNLSDSLRKWRDEHIIDNEAPSLIEKALNSLITIIIGSPDETPEIKKLRTDLDIVNDQLKKYVILYFQSPSPEFKTETRLGIKRLWQDRKKIKKELKRAKKEFKKTLLKTGKKTGTEKILDELLTFTGWLLTFYLIYYFASIYAVSKDFGETEIPYLFYIYKSSFLKYFMATLFLLHATISIKINFFRTNEVATLVMAPIFLLSTLIIYINF